MEALSSATPMAACTSMWCSTIAVTRQTIPLAMPGKTWAERDVSAVPAQEPGQRGSGGGCRCCSTRKRQLMTIAPNWWEDGDDSTWIFIRNRTMPHHTHTHSAHLCVFLAGRPDRSPGVPPAPPVSPPAAPINDLALGAADRPLRGRARPHGAVCRPCAALAECEHGCAGLANMQDLPGAYWPGAPDEPDRCNMYGWINEEIQAQKPLFWTNRSDCNPFYHMFDPPGYVPDEWGAHAALLCLLRRLPGQPDALHLAVDAAAVDAATAVGAAVAARQPPAPPPSRRRRSSSSPCGCCRETSADGRASSTTGTRT